MLCLLSCIVIYYATMGSLAVIKKFICWRRGPKVLVVIGSGGHTSEMILFLNKLKPSEIDIVLAKTDKTSQKCFSRLASSINVIWTYRQIKKTFLISRSREVGQSYVTALCTTALALIESSILLLWANPSIVSKSFFWGSHKWAWNCSTCGFESIRSEICILDSAREQATLHWVILQDWELKSYRKVVVSFEWSVSEANLAFWCSGKKWRGTILKRGVFNL